MDEAVTLNLPLTTRGGSRLYRHLVNRKITSHELVSIFADVEERRGKRKELGSHASKLGMEV
jgi:hypothetical protein